MTKKIQPINPRFLPLLKQPDPSQSSDPVELDESDVVWSDYSLSPPATSSSSPSPTSSSSLLLSRRFGSALDPAPPNLLRRKSTVSAARFIPPPAPAHGGRTLPQSAPVTVPVWTRIRIWYHEDLSDDDEEREDGVERERGGSAAAAVVPPHVMMSRSGHVAAYSVFEGAGRTLKGRDLRSVRNAVFQKTGFLD